MRQRQVKSHSWEAEGKRCWLALPGVLTTTPHRVLTWHWWNQVTIPYSTSLQPPWVPLLQQFSARRDFTTRGHLAALGGVLTVTAKEGRARCWYLLVTAEGCCLTHYKTQGGLPRQSPTPQCPQCCAQKPHFSRGHKANFKWRLLITLARQGAHCA